jgi:prevent-host-death family protein
MTVIVTLADAKLRLADLIQHAASGEEIIMTSGGEPVARLVAVVESPSRERRTLQAGLNDPPSAQVQWGTKSSQQAA